MRRRDASALLIGLSLLAAVCLAGPASGANMYDYCQLPPYVNQLTPANVMILLDTSKSMLNFAYYEGFYAPDNNAVAKNMCDNTSNPCDDYLATPGVGSGYKYYGYFNSDAYYEYVSSAFRELGAKSSFGSKPGNAWDGNFLNWLTTRRIDVIRKVLTGGKPVGGKLTGEIADNTSQGVYKRHGNIADVSPYTGNKTITFDTANSGTSSFSLDDGGTTRKFSVTIEVPGKIEGVLQYALGTRARVGLSSFNPPADSTCDGGTVRISMGGGSLPNTINEINNVQFNTQTPLGEALWTMAGYFARQTSIPSVGSPGPKYPNSNYQVNSQNDPMNYGSNKNERFPYCAKNFILLITDGEPCADGNLPASLANYAGTVSPPSPYNCVLDNCASGPREMGGVSKPFPSTLIPACDYGGNVGGLEDVALWTHTTDLRSATLGYNAIPGKQNLNLFIVAAFTKGSTLLRYAAINGGFEDSNGNNIPDLQSEWTNDPVTAEPYNFKEATDGHGIKQAVEDALSTMLKRATSGTAASVLASGEGSGANLVQAVFYPRRRFGNDIAWWSGTLKNVWYYIDPYLVGANIREETNPDGVLDLRSDYISRFYFDNTSQTTRVKRWRDDNGDGSVLTAIDNVAFEDMGNLWEAGQLLWTRDPATRTIYTQIDNSNLIAFDNTNAAVIAPYLNIYNSAAVSAAYAPQLINYVRGSDFVLDFLKADGTLGSDGENDIRPRAVGADNNVWKLGDIIQSTPRIAGKVPLNTYDKIYGDGTYYDYISDNAYLDRGMVFAGANDGMFHAFKMGKLETPLAPPTYDPAFQKAKLTNLNNPPALGYESWTFIPKNALPYLWYLSDTGYCHLYYVDLAPYVFDASIGGTAGADQSSQTRTRSSWRTVVIGGMRTGGACRDITGGCNSTTDGKPNCVKTPKTGVGYSSYFALDVTNQASPRLLWEFTDPELGFATSGPAIVRIHADNTSTLEKDASLNGKWYVVFASGPTGPVDNTAAQFLAHSDQRLKLFVVDLKRGTLVRKIDTGIDNAFGGSLINTAADFDLDYQDDAVYVGYTKVDASVSPATWTKGGVLRLQTRQDSIVSNWTVSKLIDDIGPVTTSPVRLQNRYVGVNWVFFGEGRYYYVREKADGDVELDDPGDTTGSGTYPGRWLYGLKDPCFAVNGLAATCPDAIDLATDNVVDVTTGAIPSESAMNCVPGAFGCGNYGWRIRLDEIVSGSGLGNERVITDSLATTSSGMVFFTTFKPYSEPCAIGGLSYLWVVRYNTGGAPSSLMLKGKALVQVSTASVEEIDLATAFDEKDGRRSGSIEGVPPLAQGLSILSPPPPVKRLLHMQEK